MNAAAGSEYPADLVNAVEDLFATGIDYDEVAIDLMGHAPNAEIAFAALVDLAPHLGLDLT